MEIPSTMPSQPQPVKFETLILEELFTAKDAKDAKENEVQALSLRSAIW
jgi:hypothetical protein